MSKFGRGRAGAFLSVAACNLAGCGVDARVVDTIGADAGEQQETSSLLPDAGCSVGDAYCATRASRVACRADGTWDEPRACAGVCSEGVCTGTCPPGATRCVGTTQYQSCLVVSAWSEALACPNACIGEVCGGVCVPGARRCVSDVEVQICSSAGEWGPTLACASTCSGSSCTDECVAGSTACVSETQVQQCNATRQWSAPSTCQFACVGSACAGACIPADRRCDPEGGQPQLCSPEGSWQDAAACAGAEICEGGSCSCSGDRAVCGDTCVSLTSDPEHCGACGRSCLGGACAGGQCQPLVLATAQGAPSGVAVSDTHVYFRDTLGIRRVAKTGGAVQTVVGARAGLGDPSIGGDQLYFGANGVSGMAAQRQVLRANLDGTGIVAFSPERALPIQRLITPGLFVYYTVRDTALTSVLRAPLLSSSQAGPGSEAPFATSAGLLNSMAVVNGCLFIVDQNMPRQVLRTCAATTAPALLYQGEGAVSFRSDQMNDTTHLYVLDQGRGTLRVPLDGQGVAEVVVTDNPGAPSVDSGALYYFAPTQAMPGPGCSNAQALFRAGKLPGSPGPVTVLPAPNACPSQVLIDQAALYWSAGTGQVLRLAK